MAIRVVRLGTERSPGEGLRIGTVRRPPRGVPKTEYSKRNYYDVWFPTLAPTPETMEIAKGAKSDADWKRFFSQYRKEMAEPAPRHVIALLAALSHATDFSVGCYCEDETRCHRFVLRQLLADAGAAMA